MGMADTASLSFYQYGTDNLFQNKDRVSDQISSLSFSLDKSFSKFSVFTEGDYSYLFQNPDLSVYKQDAGIDYMHTLNGRSALYFSLTGAGTFYRTDFKDFNSVSLNFFSAFKSYLSPTSIFQASYSFQNRDYNLSGFDYYSHSLALTIDKYFQTRTTLKAEMNWGYKYFIHPLVSVEPVPVYDASGNPMGMGRGHGRSSMNTPQQFFAEETADGQGIQVFSLGGLIAQGIGSKIGLRLSGMNQWNLSGKNPFATIEEYYMIENPTYDRYSWTGYQIEGQFTWLIPGDILMKMGYTVMGRKFPGIENLNLEGNSLGMMREDTRDQFLIRIEKNFPRFSLFLSYFLVNNRSNDVYFDWKGHFISAGIQWNLFFEGKK